MDGTEAPRSVDPIFLGVTVLQLGFDMPGFVDLQPQDVSYTHLHTHLSDVMALSINAILRRKEPEDNN